jgi:hypothetical protein
MKVMTIMKAERVTKVIRLLLFGLSSGGMLRMVGLEGL